MENILKKEVYELLGENYIDYAMSVITSRALPSVKDGLKPVHRRILYSMNIDGNNNNRSYKKSARAVGNCFIEDTLVATQNGLLPIKDLKVGDEVITHNGVEKVTKLYVMPEQELLKINLSNGLSNISTIGQMYKVLDKKLQYKWVEAKDLSVGDYVVCKSGKRHNTEYQTSNEIVINEDIAYFLGFFLADGYIDRDKKIGYHRIGMTCRAEKKKPVIDKIKNIIEENFNISINITNGGSNGYGFRINNVDTNTKIIKAFDLSNKYTHNITIPKEIFKSNENVKMAFVSGFLDGDGHVREGKNCIVFSSISEKFLSEMNILLFDMGYCGGKYNQITNIEHSVLHTLEYSSVYYEKMIKKLNLLNAVSCDNLEVGNINSSSHDKIPYLGQLVLQEFSEKHLGGGWYRASSGKKIRSGIKYKNGCKVRYGKDLKERFNIHKSNLKSMGILNKMQLTDSKYLEFVNDVMSNDLTFCKVKSIEKRESEVTYDIQVENAHEFIANGMIVHNCMGVFHPHGDSSIYEAMVNLAQDFSTRYPLIDMHGNVGSLDGDPAAAMRYTESRLTAIADEAMRDIEKNTVAMTNNFDGTVLEPTALPTLLPLIFMNGSEGIAVGMATKMPPHNLTEILDAADYIIAELLEGRDADPEEIFKIIKGPDFPLGAVIVGKTGIRDAFFTGKGQISVRSEYEIEELGNSSSRIAISSIPYQVNKSNLVDKIDSLRKTTIPEIKEVRDESDKDGIRICIDLKRDVNAQLIVNKLMKHTQLQANFNVNNTVIVDKKPESVGTIDMLQHYIAHCIDVIIRRSVFDHEKASARFNIVSGILWAINPDVLDNVIHAIRAAKGTEEAISAIMNLSDEINEEQAKAIAEMKLRQLTTDNEDKYTSERDLLSENIQILTEIIENSSVMLTTLRSELSTLKDRFGDARRTKIIAEEGSNDELDCIEDETLVITFSTSGIIKSVEEKEYRSTNRGAKGVKTAEIKDNDAIKAMMTVGSKEDILFFTNLGRCHVLKAYKIQKTSRTARGKSVNNYLNLEADEVIVSLLTTDLSDKQNSFALVTKNGIIKRLSFENMSTRRTVTKVMNFKDNDMLIAVQTLTDEEDILLTSACGMSIRFKGSDVRMSGRTAEGVKAINLREHDYVVDAVKVIDGQMLLTITQFGMGKKTKVKDYTLQSRAGKGIITHKLNENTGELVCANIVDDDDEIFIATAKGQIVRVDAQNISTYGRSTIGVKVVSLAEDDYIIAVSEARKENEEAEEGN